MKKIFIHCMTSYVGYCIMSLEHFHADIRQIFLWLRKYIWCKYSTWLVHHFMSLKFSLTYMVYIQYFCIYTVHIWEIPLNFKMHLELPGCNCNYVSMKNFKSKWEPFHVSYLDWCINVWICKEAHEEANAFSRWVKVVSLHKANKWLCYIILNTYPHFHIWYTE